MIRTVFEIGWINLRRDRVAILLSFALPLAFFSVFAGVFGELDSPNAQTVETMLVLEEQRPAAVRLAELFETLPAVRVVQPGAPATRAGARDAVRAGLIDAAVVIPAGFDAALGRPDASPVQVDILVDTSNPLAASIVSGALRSLTFELGHETLVAALGVAGGDPPRLQVEVVDVLGRSGKRPSVAFFASGIGVMFLMFTVSGRSAILLEERESGVLVRMLSARLGMTRLLVGRWLFLTVLGLAQVTLMFAWGAVAFGLELFVPRHLAGFAVLTPLTAATAAAFGLMLSTLCKSRQQLNGISAVVILILAALGGNLFPSFLMPEGLRTLGLATFNSWALAGYQKIFWYERGPIDLAPELAALACFCCAFLLLGRSLARRWEHA